MHVKGTGCENVTFQVDHFDGVGHFTVVICNVVLTVTNMEVKFRCFK
jgi:hypothetical protein